MLKQLATVKRGRRHRGANIGHPLLLLILEFVVLVLFFLRDVGKRYIPKNVDFSRSLPFELSQHTRFVEKYA